MWQFASVELCFHLKQPPAQLGHLPVWIVRSIHFIHAGKNRLQRVVILRGYRIKLVIMTTGTVNCGADEGGHHGRDHVIAVQVLRDLLVNRAVGDSHLRTFIPRPSRQHPDGANHRRLIREKDITRHLLTNELSVWLVRVKRLNQVITIRPRVFTDGILIVSMGLGVVNDIHPVPGPSFPVVGTTEQALNEICIRDWGVIIYKSIHLPRARW